MEARESALYFEDYYLRSVIWPHLNKLKKEACDVRKNAIVGLLTGWIYDEIDLCGYYGKLRLNAGGRNYIVPVKYDIKCRKTYEPSKRFWKERAYEMFSRQSSVLFMKYFKSFKQIEWPTKLGEAVLKVN